ncbi:MAG: hypothetical protein ACOWWH_07180 [Eubacteriaceae bacterium]
MEQDIKWDDRELILEAGRICGEKYPNGFTANMMREEYKRIYFKKTGGNVNAKRI